MTTVQECFDSNQCASGFACNGGFCLQTDTGAGGNSDGDTAGCGSGGGGGGSSCGAGTESYTYWDPQYETAPDGTCLLTGCNEITIDGTDPDPCCGQDRCCRSDENGEISCVCGPCNNLIPCSDDDDCPDGFACIGGYCYPTGLSTCDQWCTNYLFATGIFGPGCSSQNSCSECEECLSFTDSSYSFCALRADAPCYCEGAYCYGAYESCGLDGVCRDDCANAQNCFTVDKECPCGTATKECCYSSCGNTSGRADCEESIDCDALCDAGFPWGGAVNGDPEPVPGPGGPNYGSPIWPKDPDPVPGPPKPQPPPGCAPNCPSLPFEPEPGGKCDGDCSYETFCATGSIPEPPPCPAKMTCTDDDVISVGVTNCILRKQCDKSGVPEDCGECDCNCENECGDCLTCDEDSGECVPDEACGDVKSRVVSLKREGWQLWNRATDWPSCTETMQFETIETLFLHGWTSCGPAPHTFKQITKAVWESQIVTPPINECAYKSLAVVPVTPEWIVVDANGNTLTVERPGTDGIFNPGPQLSFSGTSWSWGGGAGLGSNDAEFFKPRFDAVLPCSADLPPCEAGNDACTPEEKLDLGWVS